MRRIAIQPTFEAWQAAARVLLREGISPADVLWSESGTPGGVSGYLLGIDAVGLATELDMAVSTLLLSLAKEGLKFQGGWRRWCRRGRCWCRDRA